MRPSLQAPWLCLFVSLLLASPAAHALQPFTAQYSASFKGISAVGSMRLSRQANRWTYAMGINSSVADLSQATVFVEDADVYRPIGGSDRSTYLMKSRSVVAHYDWKAMQARWTGDVKPQRAGPAKMQRGDMDALLINLALVRDVAAGRTAMTYRLVENGRVKPLQYRVTGRDKIQIGERLVDTIRVVQDSGHKRTTAWIAAGAPAPLRIVQSENGSETFRLQLTSWN